MKRYSVKFPDTFYAGTFYGNSEAEARAAARAWLGVSRLPKGTAVWLA